jgi:hypothetical protein
MHIPMNRNSSRDNRGWMLVDVSGDGSMMYSPHTFPVLVEPHRYELNYEVEMLSSSKNTGNSN